MKATARALRIAAGAIKRGGTVVFPTETVYGLGADALNPRAVARIFEIKRRPRFDPLIVHVSSVSQAGSIARLTPEARALMARFWPGPLTLVLPKKKPVPGIVTSGLDTVALRMPAHPVALALIKAAGTPIAAPSANRFGRLSPTTAAHASAQLKDGPDAVLDGGRARIGVESTVLALRGGTFTILRHGGLPQEEIEKVTGPLSERLGGRARPISPGQLSSHYAPSAALVLLRAKKPRLRKGLRYGYLAFSEMTGLPVKTCAVLSPSRDLEEAAANLFSHLHDLDAAGVDVILAEPVPGRGLGRAIMDRLRRAARGRGRK
ncbi:MAG TPA: L-threonylcarbamoyladenylate synthase, partial [Elusimicrobiales bacterium]|nr:L-threonylcarbamoyladenylate synthase [Elusimicrobiales bacterium]